MINFRGGPLKEVASYDPSFQG